MSTKTLPSILSRFVRAARSVTSNGYVLQRVLLSDSLNCQLTCKEPHPRTELSKNLFHFEIRKMCH